MTNTIKEPPKKRNNKKKMKIDNETEKKQFSTKNRKNFKSFKNSNSYRSTAEILIMKKTKVNTASPSSPTLLKKKKK
jgi:hypothetical protein